VSSHGLDYLNQFIGLIALETREMYEIPRPGDDGTPRRRLPGDRDPMASPELDESLVSQLPQGPQNRVGVHPEDLGQIAGRRQALSGTGLAFGYRSAYLGSDLFVEEGRITRVDLETVHSANYTSTIGLLAVEERR
jgi:hypothetical protein